MKTKWGKTEDRAKCGIKSSKRFYGVGTILLEKEMAAHSSTIAWRVPWTEESGRLQSMESQRVGHNWVTELNRTES